MAEEQKQMNLDDVLKEPAPVEAPPVSGAEAYKPTRQQHRDKELGERGLVRDAATGQYAPKTPPEAPKEPEKVAEAPKTPEPPKAPEKPLEEYSARERAAFAKAADETRKRQELQRRLAELEKKTTEKPFFEDPDGALERQRQELQNQINYSRVETKVQTSESIARSRYPDYDEKFQIFNQLVQDTPYLAEQAFSSNDPADFAYKTAKRHMDLEAAGGVEKMREKMEAELRAKVKAEIEAEFQKREADLKKAREELPGSLTDVPSRGVNRPVWGGPTPMEDILKG